MEAPPAEAPPCPAGGCILSGSTPRRRRLVFACCLNCSSRCFATSGCWDASARKSFSSCCSVPVNCFPPSEKEACALRRLMSDLSPGFPQPAAAAKDVPSRVLVEFPEPSINRAESRRPRLRIRISRLQRVEHIQRRFGLIDLDTVRSGIWPPAPPSGNSSFLMMRVPPGALGSAMMMVLGPQSSNLFSHPSQAEHGILIGFRLCPLGIPIRVRLLAQRRSGFLLGFGRQLLRGFGGSGTRPRSAPAPPAHRRRPLAGRESWLP